jgi:hypothetical protein
LIANIGCFSPAPTRCTTSLKPGQGCMAKKHLALVPEGHRNRLKGLVTSAAGLPSLTYSRTIRDDQNQL